MNETGIKVDEALAAWGIAFTARYIGESKQWEGQTVDTFRVSIGAYETDYHMGFGNRKARPGVVRPKFYNPRCIAAAEWDALHLKPVAPTAASVLYCLLSDMEAIDQSFVDWADDLGYDTDSRKALAIYEACCDTGRELRKVFTPTQRADLRGLLQDY